MRLFVALVFSIALCSVYGDDCPQGLCASTETCCDGPAPGLYGCCPEPNAVCCSDGLHCCPENTVCNLSAGTCDDKQGVRWPLVHRKRVIEPPVQKPKAASLTLANKLDVIYCPGGYYYCQDGTTCCLLPTGQYGCCPYPNAMCCQDGIHCCPSGTRCDATSQYCTNGLDRYAALFKRPAFPIN